MSVKIKGIKARKVYNSRGEETVEVEVVVENGFGRAAAPAGKSKGGKEVAYYPRGGVDESIKLINGELSQKLIGLDASDQAAVDEALKEFDGTNDFSRLGGNAAFAASGNTSSST